jgi:hypothetical protein
MTEVKRSYRPIFVLRVLLLGLATTFSSALYREFNPSRLSLEATQYRENVAEIMSGPNLLYGLQKIFGLVGLTLGILALVLMFFRMRLGLSLLLWCPLLLVAAALFGAAPSTYPNVESTIAIVLWWATGAIWGCTVVYASLRRDALFSDRRKG